MADNASQGAAGAAPAAAGATDKPAAAGPLGKASDLLKEVVGAAGEDKAAPAEGAKKDEPKEVKAAPEKKSADEEADERVERIAREDRRLEKKKAAWKQENADIVQAAQNWQRLQDAKTKQGKLAALNILYTRDEIEQEVYVELTNALYDGKDGDALTKEQAAQLVEKKLAEAKKAEEDARKKAEDEAKTKQEQTRVERESGFVNVVAGAFGDGAGYPAIQAMADVGKPVSGRDILAYAEDQFKKSGKIPSPEEILTHFETKFSARLKPAPIGEKPAETEKTPPTAKTVTSSWTADAPPRPNRPMSLVESLEEAKREAGLIK